ncbi:MAG: PEP/pyruvate-binding domain-containing protein [Bacteroidales bacterium]
MGGEHSNNGRHDIKLLLEDRKERLKELACINRTTAILKQGKPIEESLHQIVMLLPEAWQYPEFTVARILFEGKEYKSPGFIKSPWVQSQSFQTVDDHVGIIEIYYTREFAEIDEGPFLKEERHLIDNICSLMVGYINSYKAKSIFFRAGKKESIKKQHSDYQEKVLNSRQLLQRFLNKHNSQRDLFHDLMPFKVKEILLVATLYDAYSIEKEGRFTDYMLGQYHQLDIASFPRVTGVSKMEEALDELQNKHYDMVIVMMGVDKQTPFLLSRKLKEDFPYVPIFFLLNSNRDIELYEKEVSRFGFVDRVFLWNGDPKMFFAMVKLLEDHVNVENDTAMGFTKVILLVEDSPKYYSRYLPMIYSIVLEQTKHLIADVNTDELYKVLKLRGRPKILLASSYEEATEIFNRYREYLLCVISDVSFPRKGKPDRKAGVDLIRYVKSQINNLPTLLQSADIENQKTAHELRSSFINKNSETLLQDLKSFITYFLGFGHFVYRDNKGRQIAVAKSMREFEAYLKTVPDESLIYHGAKNHFSLWLMARGEVKIARIINPLKISDFKNPGEMRDFLVNIIYSHRNEQDRGKIVNFEKSAIQEESNIVSFSSGSLGGKGRGLAFVNSLIYNFRFSDMISGINIRTPITGIIGTDEFDIFLELNKLYDKIYNEDSYDRIKQLFLEGKLSYNLEKKLKIFLRTVERPIAIRSSSLFEDSLMQPFSGIFETYLLPNNHPAFDIRLKQAMDAIKLVFASIFSDNAKIYFESIDYKIEEEKMAIVIQEVVGNQYGDCYYPHISGTAQSHNYYPVAHMKPEEGFSVIAVGLGQYVVEGEKAYRFSPAYPALEISSEKDLLKNSQVQFYAVNMAKPDIDILEGEDAGLIRLDISEAERHGNLRHCASVYDADNDNIVAGTEKPGPRVINFANILKYDYIPLAGALRAILDVVEEALGCPVEIEFAIDLNRGPDGLPSFYLLQIKPLFGNESDYNIDEEKFTQDSIMLRSGKSMGNGMLDSLSDIIYIKPEDFDKTKTREMAGEIEELNSAMLKMDRKYILIGPGRWGTRDRFIGIPVAWPQISNAAVIVEMSMEGFPLDASLGSHFFHNLTSMNVGYFAVNHSDPADFIRMDLLESGNITRETKFFRHVRFSRPLKVLMDGKKGMALIVRE